MVVFTDLMFNTETNSTSLADLNLEGTATVGRYTPKFDGTLRKVTIIMQGQAATSLIEGVRVELESTGFTPNRLRFGAAGNGLRTAPAFSQPAFEWIIEQPVKVTNTILGQYLFVDTATTPRIEVWGTFQA